MRTVRWLGLTGVLAGAFALGGCATRTGAMGSGEQTWTLNGTGKTPAAEGKVEVAAKSEDGERQLEVKVEHLAKPDEVFTGTSTYVVWLKPQDGPPQNIGVLKVDDDLDGKLEAKTPHKAFDILVTAEPSPEATVPSLGNEVFRTHVYVAS